MTKKENQWRIRQIGTDGIYRSKSRTFKKPNFCLSDFIKTGLIVLFLILMVWGVSMAAPPESPYKPGETLNPSCSPSDINCTVANVADPTATIGLNPINGTSTTALRSDSAPALSQAITPTWIGTHIFSNPTYSALFTGGNVGIGTMNPNYRLSVYNGDISLSSIPATTENTTVSSPEFHLSGSYWNGSSAATSSLSIVLNTLSDQATPNSQLEFRMEGNLIASLRNISNPPFPEPAHDFRLYGGNGVPAIFSLIAPNTTDYSDYTYNGSDADLDVSAGGLNLRPLAADGSVKIWNSNGNVKLRIGSKDFSQALDLWNDGSNSYIQSTDGNLFINNNLNISNNLYSTKPLSPISSNLSDVASSDAKFLLYNNSSSNWSGLGTDDGGNTWIRTGTNGTNLFVFGANGNLGIGTTTPEESLELGLDKRMELSTDKTNLDESGLIRLKWATNTGKPAIVWLDEDNNRQAAIVTHDYLTYPDNRHQHFSIETSDNSGGLRTRFQIPWGSDHVEIRTSDSDFAIGGGGTFRVGTTSDPGTTVLNGNTFITGTGKLGVGFTDENQAFEPGSSMELYRNGSDAEFLIDEDSGTKEARLHLRRGTRDWDIINNSDLAVAVENNEVFRITNNGNVGIGTSSPNSELQINGSLSLRKKEVDADYTTEGETIIGVTDTTVARTITLASSDCVDGRIIIIKDESGGAGANNITVTTQGSETIDGNSTATIDVNYGSLRLYSNGTNWFSF